MFPLQPALILVVCFGISLLSCFAQNQDEISAQFLSFPKSIDPKPVELLVGEGNTIEVEIPTNALSSTYRIKRPEQWVFGKTIVKEDGKKSFEIYGKTGAGGGPNQIVLLIRKGAENGDGMDIIAIENNAGNFGGGIFFFVNAASVDIAGIIGEEKFSIKPGKTAAVKPQPIGPDEKTKKVHTKLFFRQDNKPRPFFSSTWPLNDKARSIIFFYHDPHTKRLRLHTIRDYLP